MTPSRPSGPPPVRDASGAAGDSIPAGRSYPAPLPAFPCGAETRPGALTSVGSGHSSPFNAMPQAGFRFCGKFVGMT
jgi:hypothetical protein